MDIRCNHSSPDPFPDHVWPHSRPVAQGLYIYTTGMMPVVLCYSNDKNVGCVRAWSCKFGMSGASKFDVCEVKERGYWLSLVSCGVLFLQYTNIYIRHSFGAEKNARFASPLQNSQVYELSQSRCGATQKGWTQNPIKTVCSVNDKRYVYMFVYILFCPLLFILRFRCDRGWSCLPWANQSKWDHQPINQSVTLIQPMKSIDRCHENTRDVITESLVSCMNCYGMLLCCTE